MSHAYTGRFRKVLEHIEVHLDEELTLDRLSGVAAFSRFHFHRQFSALFGMSAGKYVQLHRLKRASYQLAFRADPVTGIALESGYESPEAFARAFRKSVGQTPSAFRDEPLWESWHAEYEPFLRMRREHMSAHHHRAVRVVDFPETRVAALEHRGDPRRLGDSIRTFIAWRKENRLPPRQSATFNIVHDEVNMDLCAATERDVEPNRHGIVAKTIPAGRCAVLRHTGSDDHLPETVEYLYREWLPASGEEPRDFPLFFQRVIFFPDVPEHEAVTDVFLPLR